MKEKRKFRREQEKNRGGFPGLNYYGFLEGVNDNLSQQIGEGNAKKRKFGSGWNHSFLNWNTSSLNR